MNKKSQVTGLLFLGITAVLIGITFFLFLYQEASAPVATNKDILETPLATTTVTLIEGVTVETPTIINRSVERVEAPVNGVKREIRNEVLVKTWRHPSGTSLSLYEKDYFYNADYDEPYVDFSLRATLENNEERELFTNVSEEGTFYKTTFLDLRFSPLGTYVVVHLGGYESSGYETYDLKNIIKVHPTADAEYGQNYGQPYWNNDESKLVVVNSASGIDGISAALHHSATGQFSDLKRITPRQEGFNDNLIGEVAVTGDILIAQTSLYDDTGSAVKGKLQIDMDTGAYTAVPEINW